MRRLTGPRLSEPTVRASAIVDGLIRTGRAARPWPFHGFMRLAGSAGGFYFVAFRGDQVLRCTSLKDADELQTGFVIAMERAGALARRTSG
jgi:hypothetical protein